VSNNASVSRYGNLTTNRIVIKHSLRLLLAIIFSSWCLPYKTPAGVTQLKWTPYYTVHPLHLSNVLMEPFARFIGESSQIFRKNPDGNAENEISMTCYTLQHCVMKINLAQFYCDFPLFYCLKMFLQTF
jgi:hypothetical protein